VAGQTRGDAAVAGPLSVRLEANCPIGGVGIEFAGAVPPTIGVRKAGAAAVPAAPRSTRADAGGGTFAFYAVGADARALNIEIPAGARIAAGIAKPHSPRLVPTASAYCDRPHAVPVWQVSSELPMTAMSPYSLTPRAS